MASSGEKRQGDKAQAGTRRRAGGPIDVLVVDDSAVVRQVMTALLSEEKDLRVTTAAHPLIALEKMRRVRPHVIVLDLEMPEMDGLSFLRKVMTEQPLPVVVCSALTGPGSSAAFQALEQGAVEILTKPKLGVGGFLHDSAIQIIDAVRGAAQARLRARREPMRAERKLTADAVLPPAARSSLAITTDKVVAVAASTGGTEALRELLEAMPPDTPGLVIVQHMPEGFTATFAQRLDQSCRIEVKEAATGDRVRPGRALIAPGNRHTMLGRSGAQYAVEVVEGPLVCRHRPSADVLFRSVARAAGANAVGVIMTGMGDDGAAGLLEMKEAGAATIAQDEASCVVFGMPKAAIERGAVGAVVPLSAIPALILRRAASAAPVPLRDGTPPARGGGAENRSPAPRGAARE